MDETQIQPRTKVLKNGAVYDLDKGRIVANPGGGTTAITKETASLLKRRRQEKAAAALRVRITEATNAVSEVKHATSASAIADVGGILWSEIVLNPDAYHRDRLEAFEKLGKMAQVIPDGKQTDDEPAAGAADVINAATALLTKMQELLHASHGAIEGLVTESDISASNNVRIDATPTASPADESEAE